MLFLVGTDVNNALILFFLFAVLFSLLFELFSELSDTARLKGGRDVHVRAVAWFGLLCDFDSNPDFGFEVATMSSGVGYFF